MTESQESKRRVAPLSRRYRRALIVSVVFHAGLLLVLFYLYQPGQSSVAKSSPVLASRRDLSKLPAESPSHDPTQDAHADRIRASIQSQIEVSSKLPTEQKLDDLDSGLKRLEDRTDSKDIDQIAKTIADVMGLNRNQYDFQKPPAEGTFDVDSAQLRDVKRTPTVAGKWSYHALMVDAAGREETVPLAESEGQSAYETFEKMRQYPMAASIYRQLVMPIIQQALESK